MMPIELLRAHWDYHHWANRRLHDVAAALGEAVSSREVGPQFSAPTLRGMFAHVYSSDLWWLRHWQGRAAEARWAYCSCTSPITQRTTAASSRPC